MPAYISIFVGVLARINDVFHFANNPLMGIMEEKEDITTLQGTVTSQSKGMKYC